MTPIDKIKVQCSYTGVEYLGRRIELMVFDVDGEIKIRPCDGSDSRICKKCTAQARAEYLARAAQTSLF